MNSANEGENEIMQQPETPLGRILAEQARQDIPDNLDGWPSILGRMQSEGLLNAPATQTAPAAFRAAGPEPDLAPILKPALSEPARLKQRRNLALAGLGLAAMLALFFITISVISSGSKTTAPETVQANQTNKAINSATTSFAATPALPVVAPELDYAPLNCGPLPVLQELSPDIARMAGGSPFGLVGIAGEGYIPVAPNNPTKWGYIANTYWVTAPSYTGTVSLKGANIADGTPLWFDLNNGATTNPTLDTRHPGAVTLPSGWNHWPSYLYIPKAGCYQIEATWPGGSWEITIGAGKWPYIEPTAAPAPTPTAPPVAGLTVNAGNFSKQGKLAFIYQGNLFILDGSTGQTRQIVNSGSVGKFAWSHDGEWLAYSWRPTVGSPNSEVWMTLADGAGKHKVAASDDFAWSPVANELAVSQLGDSTGLQIVSTAGLSRTLTTLNTASAVWSSDGTTLAFVTTDRGSNGAARIMTMTAKGGSQTVYYIGQPGDGLKLLGWWPNGKGLLFQTIPANSASLSADGLAVQSLSLTTPAATPQTLVKSLVHSEWISWSPDSTRFVAVEGAGRQISSNKSLTVCDVTKGSCQVIPQPANTVSLDPAWSPDGSRIAFVRAATATSFDSNFGASTAFDAWEKTRSLWLINPDGTNPRQVEGLAGVVGVQNPQWSKDGKQLLLGHAGGTPPSGLWLAELTEQSGSLKATPRLVAGPIWVEQPGYYGYMDWTAIAAWYR